MPKISKICTFGPRAREENHIIADIFESIDFRLYVASQVIYKCGHCGHFKLKMESLRPSEAKLEKSRIAPKG